MTDNAEFLTLIYAYNTWYTQIHAHFFKFYMHIFTIKHQMSIGHSQTMLFLK